MTLPVPLRKKKNPTATLPTFTQQDQDLTEHLPGEITVAKATNVQQVIYLRSGLPSQVAGTLYCTNHRICFVPNEDSLHYDSNQRLLVASRRIPLGCIAQVNVLSSKTRKILDGVSTLPKRLSHILIVCKDVRKMLFNLKNSRKEEASSLVNAIGRHSHPSSVHLLFAFDYTRALKRTHPEQFVSAPETPPPVPSFLNARDWQRELLRLGITNDQWRVSEANRTFLVCNSMSPFFPCPTGFSNSALENAASLYSHNRVPVWCWSHPRTGVSLTRGGALLVENDIEDPDPNYRVSIAMARHTGEQVENKGIKLINVHQRCGSPKDLQLSFTKIRELCTPSSASELNSMDKHWYGSLESCEWLNIIRSCLLVAKEVTDCLCIKSTSVMLLEESKCDLSCVVSSLVELMTDAHYRSISGLECLVQKEWVALGHSFTTRHGLTADLSAADNQEAPVFLLFLDCVWQLSRQFPSAFEFSEFYLLKFYDMVLSCLYSNFLFDCAKHRMQASFYTRRSCFFGVGDEPMEAADDYDGPLLSAWSHWRDMMSKEDNECCLNPLYYIFGNGDGEYDDSNSSPIAGQLGSFLTDSGSSAKEGGNFGLYIHGDREATPISFTSSSHEVDYYQRGLLVPETSLCSLKLWDGFFFHFFPELGACHEQRQLEVQKLESRMVRDVQKLKEELNELELSLGVAYTTDLPSCIGEVVQSQEQQLLADRRESVEVAVPIRPYLTASVYSYENIDFLGELLNIGGSGEVNASCISNDPTPVSSPPTTSFTNSPNFPAQPPNGNIPHKISIGSEGIPGASFSKQTSVSEGTQGASFSKQTSTSLAQFTDALYNSELDVGRGTRPNAMVDRAATAFLSGANRSPVTKTRLRVVKSQTNDPVVAAWQASPRQPAKGKEWHRQRSTESEKLPLVVSSTELTDL